MAIRINTNISALNAQRNLGNSQTSLNKTLERLSSGLRVNRAADDAAGMAVSEKLRTQVRGLSQATGNAQGAVNLIATAESGLDQTSQILQRMRELSIQAANDTLVNDDRAKIQAEIGQLRTELTRIAETTQFNTRNLLDGSIAGATGNEAPTVEIKQDFRVGDVSATIPALKDVFQPHNPAAIGGAVQFSKDSKVGILDVPNVWFVPTVDVAFELKVVSYQSGASAPVSVALEVYNSLGGFMYSVDPADAATYATGTGGFKGNLFAPGRAHLYLSTTPPSAANVIGNSYGLVEIPADMFTLTDIGKTAVIQFTARRSAVTVDNSLTFQVGANEGQFLKMGVQDMRANALRMETLNILGTNDEDSRLKAQNAIGAIDAALEYVNTNRARLGAFQNRIEYTISNLQVSKENLTASESRIRDADIAEETANLTRNQILAQAGTSVLSQANISPQSALSLFGR